MPLRCMGCEAILRPGACVSRTGVAGCRRRCLQRRCQRVQSSGLRSGLLCSRAYRNLAGFDQGIASSRQAHVPSGTRRLTSVLRSLLPLRIPKPRSLANQPAFEPGKAVQSLSGARCDASSDTVRRRNASKERRACAPVRAAMHAGHRGWYHYPLCHFAM